MKISAIGSTGQMTLREGAKRARAVMIGLILLCGLTGIAAALMASDALSKQEDAANLYGNHALADMMHDAVRSDVLAAFQAQNPASGLKREDIMADFKEHSAELEKGIAADREYTGSKEVMKFTSALAEPMEAYLASAKSLLEQTWRDPQAASAQLPKFFDDFRTLEVSMSAASDAITENSAKVTRWANRLGMIAEVALAIILILAIGVALKLFRTINARMIDPVESLSGTMRRMGEGDMQAEIPYADREDELGEMARAMLAFRNQLNAAEAAKQEQAELIVESLGAGLTRLAEGDLSTEITARLEGPFAGLKTSFNDALIRLRDLIGTVIESAAAIQTGSSEIAGASEDLARRTEGNAASLEQTTAAISEIDARLKATSEAADRTVGRADSAIQVVASGRTMAESAVDAMGRVSESAKGIDSVIEGLDKIAFQTRVLAMNAAVEAGRAGEAGRGFAVVADLVSALAMRAEEESKRARDQLTVTQTDIGCAVQAVTNVGDALGDIVANVDEVHRLLGGIAEDNRVQASSISEVSSAIGDMDRSTQQNAAMVEETSAAARNLLAEVGSLTGRAGRFTIGASKAVAGRSAPDFPARATLH